MKKVYLSQTSDPLVVSLLRSGNESYGFLNGAIVFVDGQPTALQLLAAAVFLNHLLPAYKHTGDYNPR